MDHTPRSREPDALEERLSKLDITVAEGYDKKLCVFSTCEPLFCFEADTEAELAQLVKETLESYISTFYQIEYVKVTAETVPLRSPAVPVRGVVPLSKLLLNFNNTGHRQEAHAW